MKKSIYVVIIAVFALSTLFGQSAMPADGDKIVGARIAIDDAGSSDNGFLGTFEVGIAEDVLTVGSFTSGLGVGGALGFSSNDFGSSSVNTLLFAGNGFFHLDFLENENLDTYIMAELGFRRLSWDFDNDFLGSESDGDTKFIFDFYLGARYYFMPKLAATVELGTGFGTIRAGVDLKL